MKKVITEVWLRIEVPWRGCGISCQTSYLEDLFKDLKARNYIDRDWRACIETEVEYQCEKCGWAYKKSFDETFCSVCGDECCGECSAAELDENLQFVIVCKDCWEKWDEEHRK